MKEEGSAKVRHCTACGAVGHRSDNPSCPGAVIHRPATPQLGDKIAEVAERRERLDAINADIVWHEAIRATVEERLAEAYERRAVLEVEIRRLRGGVS